MLRRPIILLLSLPAMNCLCFSSPPSELARGTTIEARLSVATGSRISHPGDPIEAAIIAPVFVQGQLAIPQGTIVSGVVESVDRLGLGLKHVTAGIKYQFNTLRFGDGQNIPVQTRLIEVETARERVNADGTVGGIHPSANLSSGVSFYALPLFYAVPAVAAPALGIKFLIARSPDPEIFFPAGTEVILQLTAAADLPVRENTRIPVSSFSPQEMAKARRLIDASLQQQTENGRGRPSDVVNILFFGTRDQLDRAFQAAGWSGVQRRSALSLYRMYHSAVQRMGYTMAPMDKLTLNGKSPDAAYQKSLDTFSKRHHLRLWKAPDERTDVWLSAASEDVAYRFRGIRVTHATDPRIDNERAKVVNDLDFTGCLDAATLLARDVPSAPDKRGTPIVTDGSIAVLRMNDCRTARMMPPTPLNAEPRPPRRFIRGLVALRNDVVRCNPLFLAYNTTKLFKSDTTVQTTRSRPVLDTRERLLRPPRIVAATWLRPSVLDTESILK